MVKYIYPAVLFAVPLLSFAYNGYQYLYFRRIISEPLLPPSLANKQPSYAEDYATNLLITTFFAAALLGVFLYGRHREKRARGFEVLKRDGDGTSPD